MCPGVVSWNLIMLFSFVTYFALFPRWFERRAAFVKSQTAASALRARAEGSVEPVARVDAVDHAARVSFSYYLLTTCITIWTIFVITYFLAGFAKLSGLDERDAPMWPFCADACVDILAKLVYAAVIVDTHGNLFDSAELSERRLEELRGLMSVVWTASSDALAVSVRHRVSKDVTRVETSVSPTAEGMLLNAELGDDTAAEADRDPHASLRAMRFDYDDKTPAGDMSPSSAVWARSLADCADAGSAETSGFADLIRRAWRINEPDALNESSLLVHELTKVDGAKLEVEATVPFSASSPDIYILRGTHISSLCFTFS